MLDAMDVARHLVRVGYDPDCPEESVLICPLRLQKLLYYCQGWALGLLDRQLFRQPIEAWVKGPVVREVYEQFEGTRDGITPDRPGQPAAALSPTEAALLVMVWREYASIPPGRLIEMTHAEPPWKEARGDLPPDAKSSAQLSLGTMARYFRGKGRETASCLQAAGYPAIDPAAAWRAEEEFERLGGQGTTAADVFGPLLAEAGQ